MPTKGEYGKIDEDDISDYDADAALAIGDLDKDEEDLTADRPMSTPSNQSPADAEADPDPIGYDIMDPEIPLGFAGDSDVPLMGDAGTKREKDILMLRKRQMENASKMMKRSERQHAKHLSDLGFEVHSLVWVNLPSSYEEKNRKEIKAAGLSIHRIPGVILAIERTASGKPTRAGLSMHGHN